MTIDVIVAARRRTRRRVLIAVGIAVGVLVLAVYPAGLYVNSRLEPDPPPPSPSPTSTPWPSVAGLVVYPADLTWTTVAGVAVPVSATTGPHDQRGGLARGFTHTPAGAVLAAVHLLVRTTPQVGPAVFAPTLRDQVRGEHADAMRLAVADDYRQLTGGQARGAVRGPVGRLSAALAGVSITSATDQTVVLDLLTTAVDATGTSRFAATTIQVTWTGSDWALLAPPDGRWDTTVRAVTAQQAAAYPPLTQGR